ncbi:hypothetical protein ACLOJK_036807 [Asimina triloba]
MGLCRLIWGHCRCTDLGLPVAITRSELLLPVVNCRRSAGRTKGKGDAISEEDSAVRENRRWTRLPTAFPIRSEGDGRPTVIRLDSVDAAEDDRSR